MVRLDPARAAALAALEADPAYLAYCALGRGDSDSQSEALQLWTTWPREAIAPLLHQPRVSRVTEALIVGLDRRVGSQLGRGEIETYELLLDLHARAQRHAPAVYPPDLSYEGGRLRVCERCALVTRGARYARRCSLCQHLHSGRIREDPPWLFACRECGERPVTERQARCEPCEAARQRRSDS